jgi:hypothetical protein
VLDLRRQPVNPETVGRREQPPRGLLDPVAQRLRLPFGVPEFIDRIVSGTTNEVGRRTLMMLITTWNVAGGGPFAAALPHRQHLVIGAVRNSARASK